MFDDAVKVDLKHALTGGALAAGVTLTGMWLSGRASGADVDVLLRDFLPSAQAFTDTVVITSATILALMLTLLAIGSGKESHLKQAHYVRVRQIALGDTYVFVAAMTSGLLFNVPLNESAKLSESLEWTVYYSALGFSALLGGALVAIVLMIYHTVSDVIEVVGLHNKDHDLYDTDSTGDAAGEAESHEAEPSEVQRAS